MKANKSKNFISNLLYRIDKDWSTSHNHSLIIKGIIALSDKIDELEKQSHPPTNFSNKLTLLHNKIDSIYSLLEELSDRLNILNTEKLTSPNPHGDDDFATPS